MIERFHIPGAPRPAGPYSHAVRAGDFIYVSGQGPFNTETGQYEIGDVRHETRIVIINIQKILAGAGATLLQLRAKPLGAGAMADLASQMLEAVSGSGVLLIVNDRADVALVVRGGQGREGAQGRVLVF